MNIKIRKQFSKGYQIFEMELDNVPQDKIDSANAWLDKIGLEEVTKMDKAVNGTSPANSTKPAKFNSTKPTYNNSENPQGTSAAATVKQIEWLNKYNIPFDPATITRAEASRLLDNAFVHKKEDNTTSNATSVAKDPYEAMGETVTADDGLPF